MTLSCRVQVGGVVLDGWFSLIKQNVFDFALSLLFYVKIGRYLVLSLTSTEAPVEAGVDPEKKEELQLLVLAPSPNDLGLAPNPMFMVVA